MILNKLTTNPINAKMAITAMTVSNELLGFCSFTVRRSWRETKAWDTVKSKLVFN
jgi:hypothetical protein